MLSYLINLGDSAFQKEVFRDADGMIHSGRYANLSQPTSAWYNGAVYVTGYLDSTTNNSPVILQYKDGEVKYKRVGTTTGPDASGYQHQFPAVLIIGGFIYVFQVNGHGQPFNVWKSNAPEDIESGFTLYATFGENFGYCLPRLLPDGRVFILSRDTLGTYNLGQKIAISAPNDLTTWTTKSISQPQAGVRHYPSAPFYYGTNEWSYLAIQHRNDNTSPETYYAHSIYKTKDFSTFYSLDETYSKNVDTDGVFTAAEIEANFMIIGSDSARTVFVGGVNIIAINDTLYGNYFDQSQGKMKFYKMSPAGTMTQTPAPFDINSNMSTTAIHTVFHLFNGENLVHLVNEKGSFNIYSSDLNFGNIEFRGNVSEPNEEDPVDKPVIPYNLNEIEGEYIIGGAGSYLDPVDGTFPYVVTEDKFLI